MLPLSPINMLPMPEPRSGSSTVQMQKDNQSGSRSYHCRGGTILSIESKIPRVCSTGLRHPVDVAEGGARAPWRWKTRIGQLDVAHAEDQHRETEEATRPGLLQRTSIGTFQDSVTVEAQAIVEGGDQLKNASRALERQKVTN